MRTVADNRYHTVLVVIAPCYTLATSDSWPKAAGDTEHAHADLIDRSGYYFLCERCPQSVALVPVAKRPRRWQVPGWSLRTGGFSFLVPRLPESIFNNKVTFGTFGLPTARSVPCGCSFIVGGGNEDFREGVLMVCMHVEMPCVRAVTRMLAAIYV